MPITSPVCRFQNLELDLEKQELTWSWVKILLWKLALLRPIQSLKKGKRTMQKEKQTLYSVQQLKRLLVNSGEILILSSQMEILVRSKLFSIKRWENLQLNQEWWHQRMCSCQQDPQDLIQNKLVSSRLFRFKPRFKRDRLKLLLRSKLFSRIQELIVLRLLCLIN